MPTSRAAVQAYHPDRCSGCTARTVCRRSRTCRTAGRTRPQQVALTAFAYQLSAGAPSVAYAVAMPTQMPATTVNSLVEANRILRRAGTSATAATINKLSELDRWFTDLRQRRLGYGRIRNHGRTEYAQE